MMCKTALAYKSDRAVCSNQIHLVCSSSFWMVVHVLFFQFDSERQSHIRLQLENTSGCLCQRLHADRYERLVVLSLVPKRKRANECKKLTQHNPLKDATSFFFLNTVTRVNVYILFALSPPIDCY